MQNQNTSKEDTLQKTPIIKGIIIGDSDLLMSINVIIKETRRVTQTDINGHYGLKVYEGYILAFSSFGYIIKEISILKHKAISVKLLYDEAI